MPATRTICSRICVSSVASECDTKNVRITCSSYCCRFCVLSVATMMVQIATEEGRFKMANSIHEIVTKLIRRHPHIFGDTTISGVDQLMQNWDAIKVAEKAAKGQTQVSPLDGVPAHLPALEKALTACKTMLKNGKRLIAVFGSAGLRDREKRRLMAEVATRLQWTDETGQRNYLRLSWWLSVLGVSRCLEIRASRQSSHRSPARLVWHPMCTLNMDRRCQAAPIEVTVRDSSASPLLPSADLDLPADFSRRCV